MYYLIINILYLCYIYVIYVYFEFLKNFVSGTLFIFLSPSEKINVDLKIFERDKIKNNVPLKKFNVDLKPSKGTKQKIITNS